MKQCAVCIIIAAAVVALFFGLREVHSIGHTNTTALESPFVCVFVVASFVFSAYSLYILNVCTNFVKSAVQIHFNFRNFI